MKNALLVLCPTEPGWSPPDDQSLEHLLQSIQLIGEPFRDEKTYLVGDRFLELIAFMGCSPDINFEPGDNDQEFCFIRLITDAVSIEFHSGDHTHAPRCPQCRAAVDDWRKRVGAWLDDSKGNPWICESCKHEAAPWRYNWRKSAGFGRCFIEINNIYPREAMPQQALLDTLNSHYGADWHYFYQH